jgi:alkylation response protein AidB-like acyl-CoA dehydrogenase
VATTLRDRIEAIVPLVQEQAVAVEADRRITPPVLEAIRGTGLNRSVIPTGLGGDELHIVEVVDALERLAAADGSTGWCAAIGAGSNLFSGYLHPDVAAKVYADPDGPSAGMFGPYGQARPADGGGLTFSGRWPFSSNCLHSTWIGLGGLYFDADGTMEPVPRLTFVPMSEVEVEDTWSSDGLCGTGSHHTKVSSWTTDRAHSCSFVEPAFAEGALWRIPMFSILGPMLGIVPLGIARGALDRVGQIIREGSASTRTSLADDQISMAEYAMATAKVRAARAGLLDSAARAWDLAERGQPVDKAAQGEVTAAMNLCCEVAEEAVGVAHRLAGGPAAYRGHPLLRAVHDVATARQHVMFAHLHRPLLGQAIAGLDVFHPPFVV